MLAAARAAGARAARCAAPAAADASSASASRTRVPAIRARRLEGRPAPRLPSSSRSIDGGGLVLETRAAAPVALTEGGAVDNLAIARVLAEIADLLEIKSENPFKIRAYRNGADTIAHLGERVADLTPAERLGDSRDRQGPRRQDRRTGRHGRVAVPPGAARRSSRRRSSTCCGSRASVRRRSPCSTASSAIRTLDDLERAAQRRTPARPQGHGREEGGADPQGARRAPALRRAGG